VCEIVYGSRKRDVNSSGSRALAGLTAHVQRALEASPCFIRAGARAHQYVVMDTHSYTCDHALIT